MLNELLVFPVKCLSFQRAHQDGQQGIASLCFSLYLIPGVPPLNKRKPSGLPFLCFFELSSTFSDPETPRKDKLLSIHSHFVDTV